MHNRMILLFTALGLFSISAKADNFTSLKKDLAKASCSRLTFISILESDVFDRADTTDGTLTLALDGKYRVVLGKDSYLYDGKALYSYSADNNQVTVEKVPGDNAFQGQISFITRLDEFYKTVTLRPDSAYRLLKKPERKENIPDSLRVFLFKGDTRLSEIQYFDENGDLNRIVIRKQEIGIPCDAKTFVPDFPKSAEIIELN